MKPALGQSRLRIGRISMEGATYFLTFCTRERQIGLASLAVALNECAQALQRENVWRFRSHVVMPDHEHLLVTIGGAGPLSEVVRVYRGRTAALLRGKRLHWQRGYFDHCVRPNESLLPVLSYMFLNPYRAGLVLPGERWPGYFCSDEDWRWFGSLTNSGCPMPEWLA